jgi:hypothetical protein
MDPDPHQTGKLDPDLDPRQSEKVEALESHLEHWRVQIWEKVSGIWIRLRIRVKGRIRIRIKVKSRIRIRIRINVMRIRNAAIYAGYKKKKNYSDPYVFQTLPFLFNFLKTFLFKCENQNI